MEAGTLENRVTWGGLAEMEGAGKGKWLESLIVSRTHLSREEIYFEGALSDWTGKWPLSSLPWEN